MTFRSWWVVVLAGMTGAVGTATLSSEAVTRTDKVVTVVLCVALVAWRLTVGRALVPGGVEPRRLVYVAGLIAVIAGLLTVSPLFLYLLYPVVPELVMLFDRLGPAAVASGALTLIAVGAQLRWVGWSDRNFPVYGSYLSIAAVAMGFALAMFFGYVLMESRRRAELLEALDASQEQLGRMHAQTGALAERERISQEIHDTVAQGLTSILMLLQGADAVLDANPVVARGHLDSAQQAARDNLEEIRSIVAALRPASLAGRSLHDALARVVDGAGRAGGLDAEIIVSGQPRALSSPAEVVLLRVAQEAVANVIRHAAATTLRVELRYGEQVGLTVTDDGRGFDTGRAPGGYGLDGIRLRVAQLDGAVEVASARGAGTALRVALP
jgi:signal transduction histidine kinase